MKVKNLLIAGFLSGGVAIASCNKHEDNEQTIINDTDRNFMVLTSNGNTGKISLGKLASVRSTNAAVKIFGQHMVMEHTTAQTELKELGLNIGYPVKDSLDLADYFTLKGISFMSGRIFDSSYIWYQVTNYEIILTNFQTELANGSNTNVKKYAKKYLPHIQADLKTAQSTAKELFPR